MRLISRHILRSLAAPFFWGVLALTGLLLLKAGVHRRQSRKDVPAGRPFTADWMLCPG